MDWGAIEEPAEVLHGFISGYHGAQYVYEGIDTGIFPALATAKAPNSLAAELDLPQQFVRRFCEIGLRWEVTEPVGIAGDEPITDAESFRLTEPMRPYLGDLDPIRDMRDLFRLRVGFMGGELEADRRPADGEPAPTFDDRSAEFSGIMRSATHGLQEIYLSKVLPEQLTRLEATFSDGGRVLDLGCGAGRFGCSIAERYPETEVVGIDIDRDALALAREAAADRDLADRVEFVHLDAVELGELSGTFDAVVSFLSLHEIPAGDRAAVFSELEQVLSPSAVLGVFDTVYPETVAEFQRDPYRHGVETQWSELPWGNEIPTVSDQRALLAASGLYQTVRTSFGGRFAVLEAITESV